MKQKLRLKKPADFKKVFKEGKRLLGPHFGLYIRANRTDTPRLGVSISKTHCKLATTRNRLKRVAKAIFEERIHPLTGGYDFVISSRRRSKDKHMAEEQIKESLTKLEHYVKGRKR